MKLKKVVALTLVAAMTVSMLMGCKKEDTQGSEKETTKEEASITGEELDDFVIKKEDIPQEKLDTTLYVACSIRGLENPYQVTEADGAEIFCKWLDSIGQKYEYQTLVSGSSNDVEVDNFKQFTAKANGDAIIYSDPNEAAITPSLAEIVSESGGYLGTVWSKPDDVVPSDYDPNWVVHTTADDEASGKATAKALFDSMDGKGKVFAIEGMLGNTTAVKRIAGFNEVLKDYPDIEVVQQDTANWDTKEALNLVETWLNSDPDVGGIWCANDSMATGALQALDSAGLKGKVGVTGIDANTDIVEGVKDGSVVATVSSNGYLQAGYTLAICYAAWAGLVDPSEMPEEYREFYTPSILITADNIDDYLAEFVDTTPEYDYSHIYDGKIKE